MDTRRLAVPPVHLAAEYSPSSSAQNADGERTKSARAAHRLHLVRRAERNLMSYERTGVTPHLYCAAAASFCKFLLSWPFRGVCPAAALRCCDSAWAAQPTNPTDVDPKCAGWLEDEPSKLTGRFEVRPAAEQGPIIVCLDTSGASLCPPSLC